MNKPLPTLEDLRLAREAAWLWDAVRGRLVWANASGVKAFGGQSVFDLIDRPFDPHEPGIAKLAALSKTLERNSTEEVELEFPSLAEADPILCRCTTHTLADGRHGILAVQVLPENEAASGYYDDVPAALCTVSERGEILSANLGAKSLFDVGKVKSLAQLVVPSAQADGLLSRLAKSNLVSAIVGFESHYGQREARLTLRRASAARDIFAVAMLEDVTERRQLERQLAETGHRAPSLGPAEKQAFEDLGKKLSEAVASENHLRAPAPKSAKLEISAQTDEEARQSAASNQLPPVLLRALERNPTAFAIVQNGKPVFISAALMLLLEHGKAEDVLARDDFWRVVAHCDESLPEITVHSGKGEIIHLGCTLTDMPWLNGKARQVTFVKSLTASVPKQTAAVPQAGVKAKPEPAHPEPMATAKIASNDELRSILDIASDGIVTLDNVGRILSFSAGAEAIFGYRSAEVLNRPLTSCLTGESSKVVNDYLAGLEGAGLASVFNDGREVLGVVKQGGTVPLFLNIGRLQASDSKVAFCAVLRDLTTWKRTEKELRDAKESAEVASRHKSEFLARVSHELRTPLNAIMGFSDIMRLGQFGEMRNEKYQAYVNDIHASGGHLLSMINDLLDLSKIESGRMELNFTAVSLHDCFDHAARQLQEQATRARVLVRKSFPDNLPRIVADLRSMRQVMSNLLSNAIKYTDPGGQVIVSASVAKNGALSVRLKDTGIGMKADELEQALLPFSRVQTPGRDRQGTGLGLPLTKALVEANRANFSISSEPGQGTLIEITFPTTRVLAE